MNAWEPWKSLKLIYIYNKTLSDTYNRVLNKGMQNANKNGRLFRKLALTDQLSILTFDCDLLLNNMQ